MLACWNCEFRFSHKIVLRDGVLKGREASKGGPFRTYGCPSCHKQSRIENTPSGKLFASPLKEIGAVEFLFSWAEALNPTDFLRIVQWNRRFSEARRHFFEREGDHRYSKRGIGDLIGRFFTSPEPYQPPAPASESGASRKARPERRSRKPAIPHPYRILGVEPGASPEEIRRAFQQLARKYHPDKQRYTDPERLEQAARRLDELLQAYEKLMRES